MQLEQRIVSNSYLTLECEIVLFERYHIQVIFATELPQISIWRASGTFQILKSLENVKSRSLKRVRNENLFPQTILDKKGWRQIHEIKQNRFFSGMFYSWLFCHFLPKSIKVWLLGGRLDTRHQIQAFQRFSWRS